MIFDLFITYSLPVNIFTCVATNFQHFSDTTKSILIASMYIHLKCNKFAKHASDLSTVSPRILLSGPSGNPLFQLIIHF